MTNEEARAYFIDSNERIISVAKDENRYNYETRQIEDVFIRRTFEANELAIKALEQEPCGDCISRDAVMHILDEVGGDFDSPREAVVPIDYIADMVSELPFVTAQPKMGRWIYHDGYIPYKHECSECGKRFGTDFNYCPNCGAKMSEIPTGAEGSDKE